jgi:hypothetical protein
MNVHGRHPTVIEAGTTYRAAIQIESERFDQMQLGSGVGAEPDHVAGIGWYLRLEQHDMEHARMVTPSLYNLCMSSPAASLRYRFLGLDFASPIVLLSGCVGFGEEYTRIEGFSNTDCGGIVLKGTTLEPRLGNRPHRVYETPMGMLNAIGLQNPGTDHVVSQILPALDFTETRFIANVSGSTIEEYAEVTRRFDDSPIDAIEINISCPNVKEGGVAFGNYPEMSARVVAACNVLSAGFMVGASLILAALQWAGYSTAALFLMLGVATGADPHTTLQSGGSEAAAAPITADDLTLSAAHWAVEVTAAAMVKSQKNRKKERKRSNDGKRAKIARPRVATVLWR